MNMPTGESFVVFAIVMLVIIACRFGSLARGAGTEALTYRLPQSKTIQVNDDESAWTLKDSLLLLGCRVRLRSRGAHFNLKFHCPQWKTIKFVASDKTNYWEGRMQSLGFETRCLH